MTSLSRPAPRRAPEVPWFVVSVLLAGTGFVCAAPLAWSGTLLVVGVLLLLAGIGWVSTATKKGDSDAARTVE